MIITIEWIGCQEHYVYSNRKLTYYNLWLFLLFTAVDSCGRNAYWSIDKMTEEIR